jgi:putative ABC transport system permease protein
VKAGQASALRDLLGLASLGLRTKRARAALSELGIGIGVAAVVGVLGISTASEADLLARIGQFSNLLQVAPGPAFGGATPELPATAPSMIGRMDGVQGVGAVAQLTGLSVRRTDLESAGTTRGIAVLAAQPGVLHILDGSLRAGTFLDAATARYPALVLGAVAAERLGVDRTGVRLWIGSRWFSVVGILQQLGLPSQQDLDASALIGFPEAESEFQYDGAPTTVFVRVDPPRIGQVQALLAATANPEGPEQVQVTVPSDALAAQAQARTTFTTLFIGLGAVSLLVGGVQIANVMLMSVLERRTEIGLRRALGATRVDIGLQFLAESVLLSGMGGLAGILTGVMVTAVYTRLESQPFGVPPVAIAGGLGVAVVMGTVAGLYPALRATRLSPTEALASA